MSNVAKRYPQRTHDRPVRPRPAARLALRAAAGREGVRLRQGAGAAETGAGSGAAGRCDRVGTALQQVGVSLQGGCEGAAVIGRHLYWAERDRIAVLLRAADLLSRAAGAAGASVRPRSTSRFRRNGLPVWWDFWGVLSRVAPQTVSCTSTRQPSPSPRRPPPLKRQRPGSALCCVGARPSLPSPLLLGGNGDALVTATR